MRTTLLSLAIVIAVLSTSFERGLASQDADAALRERARVSLRTAVEFYRTKVATEGGYHFAYAEDLSYGRSEMSEGPTRVEIQREGTPLVGMAYLEAYTATADAVLSLLPRVTLPVRSSKANIAAAAGTTTSSSIRRSVRSFRIARTAAAARVRARVRSGRRRSTTTSRRRRCDS